MDYFIDNNGLSEARKDTVNEILELLAENNKVCCVRYTGFGKSYYVVPNLVKNLIGKVLIIVPSISLMQQYISYFENNKDVTVITYQIIKNIDEDTIIELYGSVKYIICDECHHLGNNVWRNYFDRFNGLVKAKVIGLTATPIRGDSVNVVESYFNNVQIKPLELIDGIGLKFLPKIKYVVAYADIDTNYKSKLSDIDRYKIENLLNVANILKKHISLNDLMDNPKILVYVPSIKYIDEAYIQCNNWFSNFDGYNINIYTIHSAKCPKENLEILENFKSRHNENAIDILISVDMVTEGLHLPNISIEIMLRKTKSPVKYFQQLGRVINNKQPIVFDLINNSKHLYQMKKEYQYNMLSNRGNHNKVMFDECVNLVDETVDIQNILIKYISNSRIPNEIRLQILEDAKCNMSYKDISTKYAVSIAVVEKILREFGFKKLKNIISNEDLHNIYINNKEFIFKNSGKLTKQEISEHLNISIYQLKRLCEVEKITINRLHPPIKKELEKKDEFIRLYNENGHLTAKAIIQAKLNLNEIEYKGYLRDDYIRGKINTRHNLTLEEENYIVNYIKSNSNLCRTQLSRNLHKAITVVDRIVDKYKLTVGKGKRCTKLTKSDELSIIATYKEIGTLYGVSKKLGYHKSTVKKCLIKYGIEPPKPSRSNRPITEEEKLNIYNDYYKNGLRIVDIRKKYHRDGRTIRPIINKRNNVD